MNHLFSQRVTDVLAYSREEAMRLQNSYIGPEHLLLGLLREGEGKAIEILKELHADLPAIKQALEVRIQTNTTGASTAETAELNMTEEATKILKLCMLEAKLFKQETVDTEHLLLAILHEKNNGGAAVLAEHGIYYQKVMDQPGLRPDVHSGLGLPDDDEDDEDELPRSPERPTGQDTQSARANKPTGETPVLDNFGTDLTRYAEEGRFDPIVGREKEIERLAQILSRRKKNNPILIGEPGVGKSAIVEGLAMRIMQRRVARSLFGKRIVALDMAAVVAGTKYRGQFEERIRSILEELKRNPHIVLFIDEIHTLVGAGAAAGSMDAANMLKPALARGEIQCIGATTLDEFRKHIEKDGALERRFQQVLVEPTTEQETLQILHNIKDRYEDHHHVRYTEAALEACVRLTGRYVSDRNFPDKAIDALDEAGARVHIGHIEVPKEIEELEKEIETLRAQKNEAVGNENYKLAANCRDKILERENLLEQHKRAWEEQMDDRRQVVDEDEVAQVVSMTSGVPAKRMGEDEGERLLHMADELNAKVIAQPNAIRTLVKAIQRSRVGLKDPNRPIGSFLFVGPTGVGKTLLAKELALLLFGSTDALIRVDMSEYMEKYAVSRLVGAPPGYVGYEDGGQLTEKVHRKPYSIVLLDEIEKAHADVFNLLLQVMDEGRLTDSNGRTIDFKNTVIIMTSNVGTRQLKEFGKGLGFAMPNQADDEQARSRSVIQKALDKTFAPEFLNRIDEIVSFDPLSAEAVAQLVDIELKALDKRVEDIGYKLVVSDEVRRLLARKGYDARYGARPLKRAIQTYLENALAERLLAGGLKTGDTLVARCSTDNAEQVQVIQQEEDA